MEKNTILALVLCSLVLAGYIAFDTLVQAPKREAAMQAQQTQEKIEQQEKKEKAEELSALISASDGTSASVFGNESSADQNAESETQEVPVEEFTVTTNKAKIVLTNRGGDIVSYKLTDHKDKDTGFGVEMADNVTSTNRAFSLAFGDASMPIINSNFKVKKINDYTIGFYRDFTQKDALGNAHTFRLGKLYEFKPDDYAFRLSITINTDDAGVDALNVGGASYTIRTSPQMGPHFNRKIDRYEVREYLAWNGKKKIRKPISNHTYNDAYEWAGTAGKYFTILVKPEDSGSMVHSVRVSNEPVDGYENAQVFLTRNAITNGNITDRYYVYVGPRSETELIKYNNSDKNGWNLINAYFNQALKTGGFLSIFEIALKWSLERIYTLVHNWGIAIIILTILLKIVLFPLNTKSAMGSIKMQSLQPKVKELQEKYKDDQQKLQMAMGKLYKEAGYNPASGCLPMVLQMVVLFALYNVFNNYFEFRGASFIKGWIDDLSVGDKIFTWNKEIPLISQFTMNTLRLLPFVYTASQLLNGVITQYGNAAAAAQNQASMKMMMYGMPIFFFFLFYNVPSGLLLYWTVSNVLQIGQQLLINNMTKKKRAEMEQRKTGKMQVFRASKGGKKRR